MDHMRLIKKYMPEPANTQDEWYLGEINVNPEITEL